MQFRLKRVVPVIMATLLLAATPAGAGDIVLRRSVRLAPDMEKITLADIATLRGEHAEALADTVIMNLRSEAGNTPSPLETATELSLREIRTRLTDAGVHWGKVHLTGETVILRPSRSADVRPPVAMTPLSIKSKDTSTRATKRPEPESVTATSLLEQQTLAAHVTRTLMRGLRVAPNDLRLVVDPDDADLLATPDAEYRFEIRPLGNLRSDRVELAVNLWKQDLLERRAALTLRPLIRTTVLIVQGDVRRNDLISSGDIEQQSQWLSPNQAAQMADALDRVGMYATRTIREGEPLRTSDVRGSMVVSRGDRVIVRCIVGATVIAVESEAREDGAVGQTIEFRKIGERETFTAEVAGPGEAVRHYTR